MNSTETENSVNKPTSPASRRSRGGMVLAVVVATTAGVLLGVFGQQTIREWIGHPGHQEQTTSNAAEQKQLWTCGMHPQVIQDHPGNCPICGMALEPMKMDGISTGAASPAKAERKISYWWDPMMNPPYISDGPGKSPMGMDLVPVYADEISGGTAITIDPAVVQNMGVRVAKVTKGPVIRTIRAVGYLQQAQPLVHDVNLRVGGWVEKLYADTEGMLVKKGQPLFELYSPEVQTGMDEFLIALRSSKALPADADPVARQTAEILVQTARRKLEQWGLQPAQIDQLADLQQAPRTVTFLSPVTAEVRDKMVVQGAMVKMGERAMSLVDRSVLWLDAQVYAQDYPFVRGGQKMIATVEGIPGKEFEGEVVFINPQVDSATRTTTVRLSLPNPELLLRPGMFATATLRSQLADETLLVPREAVLDTGTRQVVFVSMGDGHFEPRKVKLGNGSEDGFVQVLSGLQAGELAVTSGQFLMDSESRMKEAIQKHLSNTLLKGAPPASGSTPPQGEHQHSPAAAVAAAAPADVEAGTTAPASTTESSSAWRDAVTAAIAAYLPLSQTLGAIEESPTPLDPKPMIAAAEHLEHSAQREEQQKLASAVKHGAAMLDGKRLDEQRDAFKHLSAAVIALADATHPKAPENLYVLYCPMAKSHWLQVSDKRANPYFATDMKQCAEVQRTIEAAK